MEYSPQKMSQKLVSNKFNLKKKFGQNFIIDENIINKIIDESKIDNRTLVIEIGPGAGSLTYKLAKKAENVLCYEIDESLKEILKDNLNEYKNVNIIFQDFLKSDVIKDISCYEYEKIYLISNLPYYITTPIIKKIIENNLPIDKMIIMVQKEVGDRFKATVGSREYNSLSIYLNYYYSIRKIMDVSKNVFIPKPKVDSIVLELVKKDKLLPVNNLDLFFKIVRDSFTQKRKTLKNNLKDYPIDQVEEVLNKYGMNSSVRAEQISSEVFAEIANKIGG